MERNNERGGFSRKILVLMLALMLLVFGCGQQQVEPVDPGDVDEPIEVDGGIVVWRVAGEPHTLNPVLGADAIVGALVNFTAEYLGGLDYDGEWDGRLAEDYTVSEDGLTYTFHLREGVKWHDGHPFTADDVVFTYELALIEEAAFVRRSQLIIDGDPIRWEKIDDYTVQMHLPKPHAAILDGIRIPIIPKHLLEDVDPADIPTCEYSNSPISTGPFKFVEYRTGEYIKLERFDDYWGGRPHVEEVILQIIPDVSAAKIALQTGEIDVCLIDSTIAEEIRGHENVQLYQSPTTLIEFYHMNLKQFPFDDLRVRRAMNHSLNREAVCNDIYLGYGVPAYNFLASVVLFHNEDVVVRYPFDLDEAARLLAEAGFEPGTDGILQKDGQRLEFELLLQPGKPQQERGVLLYQSDLAKIGVKANTRTIEVSAFIELITAGTDPLPYEMAINTYGPGMDPDGYRVVWHSSGYPAGLGGWNYVTYTNPQVDELFDRGRVETDPLKRAQIYEEMQRIVTEDAATVPVCYPERVVGATKRVDFGGSGLEPQLEKRFPDAYLLRVTE